MINEFLKSINLQTVTLKEILINKCFLFETYKSRTSIDALINLETKQSKLFWKDIWNLRYRKCNEFNFFSFYNKTFISEWNSRNITHKIICRVTRSDHLPFRRRNSRGSHSGLWVMSICGMTNCICWRDHEGAKHEW